MTDECPWLSSGVKLSYGAIAEKRRIVKAREELKDALAAHTHILIKKGSEDYAGADCVICEKDFGWWCPESPDHACHYYSITTADGFTVTMINGEEYLLPKDHVDTYETEDQCIFCGQPEERK
jgi:hypothetical protein